MNVRRYSALVIATRRDSSCNINQTWKPKNERLVTRAMQCATKIRILGFVTSFAAKLPRFMNGNIWKKKEQHLLHSVSMSDMCTLPPQSRFIVRIIIVVWIEWRSTFLAGLCDNGDCKAQVFRNFFLKIRSFIVLELRDIEYKRSYHAFVGRKTF